MSDADAVEAQEESKDVIVSTSSLSIEHSRSTGIGQAIPGESLVTITSRLALQLDIIEAGFSAVAPFIDSLALEAAALLNEGRTAGAVLKREVTSQTPRFDVIDLCQLVLKRVVAQGTTFVNVAIISAGTAAGRTIGYEAAHKLLNVDLATLLVQLERWLHFYH
jgi:hypothetical protein